MKKQDGLFDDLSILPVTIIPEALCPHCGEPIVLSKPKKIPASPPGIVPIPKK